MSFPGSLQRPLFLSLITLFLSAAPSIFFSSSRLSRTFSPLLEPLIALSLSIFFMLLAPMVIIRLKSNRALSDFGWRNARDTKEAIKLIAISLLILIPIIVLLSFQDGFREYYSSRYTTSVPSFFLDAGLFTLLYYIAEGFLFFGFLFFYLWPRMHYYSFLVVSALFSFLHFAKPPLEILLSFFSALLFCHLSIKTKSIFPAAIVHFIIAFILNTLITFGL